MGGSRKEYSVFWVVRKFVDLGNGVVLGVFWEFEVSLRNCRFRCSVLVIWNC